MKFRSINITIIFGIIFLFLNAGIGQSYCETFNVESNINRHQIDIINRNIFLGANSEIISMLQQIDTTMILGYIENLTSFGLRETGTDGCKEVAKYIYDEFVEMGLDVRYQNWTQNNLMGSNIEAIIHGVNTNSNEIYILCAHYDTYPTSPGADDNAAGVSAVLSAAKIMSQFQFMNSVRFVSFAGEEQGWIGSAEYSNECLVNNENIVAVLDPDATGFAITSEGERKVKVFDYENTAWITDFIDNTAQCYYDYINLEVVRGGHNWHSAHTSFYQKGYDAIAFFEYDANPNLHSNGDTIENMKPEYATKVSKLCLATLIELSELHINGSLEKPSTPNGPTSGTEGGKYSYFSSATDSNDNDLYYLFDWGDGSKSIWIGPLKSGEQVVADHIWNDEGNYNIKVKAKNDQGVYSEWSDPLEISMPKNHFYYYMSLRLLELFEYRLQFLGFLLDDRVANL